MKKEYRKERISCIRKGLTSLVQGAYLPIEYLQCGRIKLPICKTYIRHEKDFLHPGKFVNFLYFKEKILII